MNNPEAAIRPALEIRGLSKTYRLAQAELIALQDVDLMVGEGEFVTLLGTSGCGKTTLLRIVLGLEGDFDGQALLRGQAITGPSERRGIVFQEHRLLPWLTVADNIGFALHREKSQAARRQKVQALIDKVGLQGFGKAWPSQLSGGMAQRAAIARALVNQPDILLLDEPLGALDALTRLRMQRELLRLWREECLTTVMVTHDIEEAVFLSDRIVVMTARPGRIKRIIPVPLRHPRDRDSPDFIRIKEELLAEFELAAPKDCEDFII